MSIKSFGTLLIIIGVFMSFSFFVFCRWDMSLDFISNMHYAFLYGYSPTIKYGLDSYEYIITLGQGLLLALFLVSIGTILNREILDSKLVIKLLPFLK